MGKGGGGASTAGLENAARESNELQRQIYEESVQRGQPYYDVGVGGLNNLANLMGITTGNTPASRQSLVDQYSPQFTTTGTAPAIEGVQQLAGGGRVRPNDQGFLLSNISGGGGQKITGTNLQLDAQGNPIGDRSALTADQLNLLQGFNTQYGGTGSTTDTAALNAYVDQQLANQQDQQSQAEGFGSLLAPFSMEQFQADPSYAFRQAEGNKAIERALAAQGKSYTPEAIKALQGYNQDLASQEFTNAYNRYNQDQGNVYNRLANLAGVGQTAINQLDQAGGQFASNVGQTNASLAQSQLAAQQANQANRSSMFGNVLGLGGQLAGVFF